MKRYIKSSYINSSKYPDWLNALPADDFYDIIDESLISDSDYRNYWVQTRAYDYLSQLDEEDEEELGFDIEFEAEGFMEDYDEDGYAETSQNYNFTLKSTKNSLELIGDIEPLRTQSEAYVLYTSDEVEDFLLNEFEKILNDQEDKFGEFKVKATIMSSFNWNRSKNESTFGPDKNTITPMKLYARGTEITKVRS